VKDKKLNILFLSGWYPSRLLPTLGNFVQKHAEAVALRSNVIALHVCSDAACKEMYEITESDLNNVHAINVYYKKVTNKIPVLARIQKLIRIKKAYSIGLEIAKKRSGKIDIVHHNILYPSGMMALYLKRLKGIPYIITEHSTAYLPSKKTPMGSLEKMFSRMIARNASFITPVSMDLRDAMRDHGLEGNYEVVYNVADTKLFYPPKQKSPGTKIKFLHISTLDDSHKNISGMLRSAAELSKTQPGFECWFVGDGDTAPHIETAKKLNIYNLVAFFEGTRTTVEIAELMRASDCFILFSNYENLPVVIIEALASGLPVISSDVGGIHEHISPERGMLVPAKDEKAFIDALSKMISDIKRTRYNSSQLAAYADENFSYEKVSEKFHHLYQRILKNNV
jgi:glycosyltransferase involved in cell wall biosynthesis